MSLRLLGVQIVINDMFYLRSIFITSFMIKLRN